MAVVAAVALRFRHDAGEMALGIVFVATLAAITVTDLERRIIPNRILLVASALAVAIVAVSDLGSLPERLAAAAGAGGALLLAALVNPQGMGMGDVKLAATMGLFLGVWVIPALLIAFAAGAAVGVVLIARDGLAARRQVLPFGPFLAFGGAAGLLAGQALIDWYVRSFS